MKCARCGGDFDRLHPLDAVVHDGPVCDDCLKPWDTVVDV